MMGEMVQECPRSKLGLDVFLSPHKGFLGAIKECPEDFCVTEINSSGKLAQLQSEADATSPPNDKPTGTLHNDERNLGDEKDSGNKANLSSTILDHPNTSNTGEHVTFDDLTDVEKLKPTLQRIVGLQVMDDLKTFFEQEFDRNKHNCSSATPQIINNLVPSISNPTLGGSVMQTEDPGLEKRFSLGVILEKDERTFVHKAVQCIYPHLKTSAIRLPDNTSYLVQASANPIYWDFRRLLSNHQTEKIIQFACSKFSTRTISVDSVGSKEERTTLHRMISKHFGKYLESKTCMTAGKQEVVLRFRGGSLRGTAKGLKGRGVQRKSKDLEVIILKENLETLDALQQLGRVLKVQLSDFSYAGIKDKKAVTFQSVAVKGVGQKRFKQLITGANLPGITVGNVFPLTSAIHVGDLTGNLFDILICDVHFSDGDQNNEGADDGALLWPVMDNCFKSIEERGFVNYFGEQRFGLSHDGDSQSAAIGQSILAGKYKQAIQLILCPDGDKDDPVNNAKHHFQKTQNSKETLALMPKYKSRECLVLKALHRHGLDREGCMRALYCIPHAMRQFYIHAFCSLVWNHMASERLRLYGYKVVVGDLVLMGDEKRGTRDKIYEVTKADIQTGAISIKDVVLPLPGNSIRYPNNRVGEAYRKYMEEEGLGQCTYRVTELQMNIPGDYRRLIEWPRDLGWGFESPQGDKILRNDQVKWDSAKQSCVDKVTGFPTLPRVLGNCSKSDTDTTNHNCFSENLTILDNPQNRTEPEVHDGESDSRLKANRVNLRVKFKLLSSTYATVFLRELMKNKAWENSL